MKQNCIVYIVDSNEQQNEYLRLSLKTLKDSEIYDKYVITERSNQSLKIDNSINILYLEEIERFFPEDFNKLRALRNRCGFFSFLRLIIPMIDIFQRYNRILYLDNDIEIVNSIDDLFINGKIQFKDYQMIGLVKEIHAYDLNALKSFKRKRAKRLDKIIQNINKEHEKFIPVLNRLKTFYYYNAGVCLFNIENINKRIAEYRECLDDGVKLEIQHKMQFADQDILNITFEDRILQLPSEYNSFKYTILNFDIANCNSYKIIHYPSRKNKEIFLKRLSVLFN